jgi:hypothetical protein
MAVPGNQTLQSQHHDAFSGVEEMLGAHVDDNAALAKRIQQLGAHRKRESYLLSSHLPLCHRYQQQAGRLTGHVAYPACVPLLGYSGYVWHRRRPRAESILLCHSSAMLE